MARLFGLSAEQVVRIRPLLPQEQGVKRVDDRKVLSGITHGTRRALRWVDAPAADGSRKALYIRCRRWSDKGALTWSFPSELSAADAPEPSHPAEPEVLMIDATDLKAHSTAFSLNTGGLVPA